MLIDSSKEM